MNAPGDDAGGARLAARPAAVSPERHRTAAVSPERHHTAAAGAHELSLAGQPAGLLAVPAAVEDGRPLGLTVLCHGAGSTPEAALAPLGALAAPARLALLAPASRGRTWDGIEAGFGVDVAAIDALLGEVFGRILVDPRRVVVGGFSDGASYALSVGLANGDLFTHVVAFSPGFVAPVAARGRPHVFVSHGTRDPVLPIDRCSRRIVPALERGGYDVRLREFDGGHVVPPEVAVEAVEWLGETAGAAPGSR